MHCKRNGSLKLEQKKGMLTLEVFRIKKNESNSYAYGLYATRDQAIKSMPKEADFSIRQLKLDPKKIWDTISKEEVLSQGVYRQDEFGMNWTVESQEYQSEEDAEKDDDDGFVLCDYDWHDPEDSDILEDGAEYTFEVDGDIFQGVFCGDVGTFVTEKGQEYRVEDTVQFKRN